MSWNFLDRALLAVSIVSLSVAAVPADGPPGVNNCKTNICVGIIQVVSSDSGQVKFYKWDWPDCRSCKCSNCSCPDAGGQQTLDCVPDLSLTTRMTFYQTGDVYCTLVQGGKANGDLLATEIGSYDAGYRYKCQ
jgi:hypothetical protein